MHVRLHPSLQGTPEGKEGADLLGRCVHCGFCLAVCPTYRLLGNELDGPRGRLYLVKGLLEGAPVGESTQLHLDRCLTCRACETACPSGVEYAKALELGRMLIRRRVPRPWSGRLIRQLLRSGASRPRVFRVLHAVGRAVLPALPRALHGTLAPVSAAIPRASAAAAAVAPKPPATGASPRRVLLLAGCVQPTLSPGIHQATVRVLAAIGIQTVVPERAGCCGAVRQHLDDPEGAKQAARRNIDAWWPWVEGPEPVEAIVSDASGCGVQMAEYGYLLRQDPLYAEKAARLAAMVKDLIEVVAPEASRLRGMVMASADAARLVFQAPCTLQHGLRIRGRVEALLRELGAEVVDCAAADQCCGAAGTYALLQPAMAQELRSRKLAALLAPAPDEVLSANATCLTHLGYASASTMRHWVEWVQQRLQV